MGGKPVTPGQPYLYPARAEPRQGQIVGGYHLGLQINRERHTMPRFKGEFPVLFSMVGVVVGGYIVLPQEVGKRNGGVLGTVFQVVLQQEGKLT